MSLAELRKEYRQAELHRKDLDPDPIRQFDHWFRQAVEAQLLEPSAMALATADLHGRPSVRIVLLKGADSRGFSFFTNYESRKGLELAENPWAALVVYWAELERQVRATGEVTILDLAESTAYFASRPHGSQISTWVSQQSKVVANRRVLEEKFSQISERYPSEVPLPPFWGGYILRPAEIEFGQGRPNRLHDRFRYARQADGQWLIERLAP